MTNEEFKYWINGYMALSSEDLLTVRQLIIIKNHIDLVDAVDGPLETHIESFQRLVKSTIDNNTLLNRSDLKHSNLSYNAWQITETCQG